MSKAIEIVIDKNGNISLDLKNIPADEHSITEQLEKSIGTVIEKNYKEYEESVSVLEKTKVTV